jgi:hypothetical protein
MRSEALLPPMTATQMALRIATAAREHFEPGIVLLRTARRRLAASQQTLLFASAIFIALILLPA